MAIDLKLIDYLADKSKITNKGLIEKDLILHSILISLQENNYFKENYIFKGGTCLIKCYLGYYRFSEDLDFSFINKKLFENKSNKKIRKIISNEIKKLIEIFIRISKSFSLDFSSEKNNPKYFEYGGGNKFLTLKIWYNSKIIQKEQFIKIQINFIELFKYKIKKLEAKTLLNHINQKELKFLFPQYAYILLSKPQILVYDIREILVEKVRAILTRKEIKARDFIDSFLILKYLNKDIESFERNILTKTKFMLKFEKYATNIKQKNNLASWVRLGEEKYLILKPLNGYEKFVKKFEIFLNKVIKKLINII